MTDIVGCPSNNPSLSFFLAIFLPLNIEAENARSTFSQPLLRVRHGHVLWSMLSKNLLGSPRKDFFSPWKDRRSSLFCAVEHGYLRKLWLELWEPSCDYEGKAKKIKSEYKVLTLVNCSKSYNHQPLAFVLYLINLYS